MTTQRICKMIPIDKIEQNENSRVTYKRQDLSELMGSLKEHGQLQPVGVRELPNGKYDMVWGNRRLVAAQHLGWHDIEAKVVTAEDENERDILNLIENLKRQNTTLAEDGRIFAVLMDRGLSKKEVAVRVGVSEERVQTALDVFNEVPKHFQKLITNNRRGPRKPGEISASLAHNVMNLKRKFSLKREDTTKLLTYAQKEHASVDQLRLAAPLLKEGYNINDALQKIQRFKVVELRFLMDQKHVTALEKKTGKSIQTLALEWLEESNTLMIERIWHSSDPAKAQNANPEVKRIRRSLRSVAI